ncbi:MAG: site-2 protease family protein, partial [Pseudomonadota bacterium]
RLSAGEELTFSVDRDGEQVIVIATPRRQEIDDAFGNKAEAGVLGVIGDPEAATFVRYSPVPALGEAARQVWRVISGTVKFLSRLVVGKEDTRQLGGPIKMAQYAGQSAMSGFGEGDVSFIDRLKVSLVNFINLAAVVSVSIGFLNLLPVPVLDGGHLLFYAVEGLSGRPLSARAQAIGFQMGMVLLASFMIFVTWNDIANLLSLLS